MSMRPYYPPCECSAPGSATADQRDQIAALAAELHLEDLEQLAAEVLTRRRVRPRERLTGEQLSRRCAGLILEDLYRRRGASNPGVQIAQDST